MSAWTPESVLAVSRSFMESRIILAGAELDVFSLLSGTSLSLEDVTQALKTSPRGTAILLDALAAMGLLRKADGRYSCPKDIACLLSAQSPTTLLPMMRHAAGLWKRWSQLTDIVRHGRGEGSEGASRNEDELAAFIGAMHVIGRQAADAIAAQAQAGGHDRILDVGGATGTYAEAFLRKYPGMRATIFDRLPVIQLAQTRLSDSGLMDRITLVAGDFYTDELPAGHDLALLSAIIHQNSHEQNTELYRKVFRALVPGGRIIIRDHVMNPDRTQPPSGALFAVNMLVGTAGGNCYTFEEIEESLVTAGFTRVRLLRSGERMDALVEAYKP